MRVVEAGWRLVAEIVSHRLAAQKQTLKLANAHRSFAY